MISALKIVLRTVYLLFLTSNYSIASKTCGKQKILLQQLVTHGYSTHPGEFPWHVALFMAQGFQKSYICGGTLVNEVSVLTAAHCVTDSATALVLSPSTLFVQVGKFKLNLYSDTVQEHAVHQVLVYEDFQQATSRNDLAVLKLATQVKFTDYVQPICVFPQPPINLNDGSVRGVVVGWGYTEHDNLADDLRGTTLPLVSHTRCLESNPDLFDRTLNDEMFCAGHRNGTNVCNGDSGGGMYYNQNGNWYLIGIVSFTGARSANSNLCSTKDYTGFTKVAAFESFIKESCGLLASPQNLAPSAHMAASPTTSGGNGKIKRFQASSFAADQKVNWFQAGDYCRSIGQHLAEIKSTHDNAKVKEIVSQTGMETDAQGVSRIRHFWIGANDLGENLVFKWQFSGKVVTFTNWRQNEPNYVNKNTHCAAVLGNKNAFWINANCNARKQVLCEVWK
ncbi:CLIP domain-containing serine protease B15-like [Uranotaenia lowii]|uniref:CLIP domain-containing serine protease B15-like n=1 Tax=Uranotaenia lowii TaxID=190385 RepID=UPI00247AE19E|nr:CLIP domain-containing serine protease B15-like [Uranotaenia lowii]